MQIWHFVLLISLLLPAHGINAETFPFPIFPEGDDAQNLQKNASCFEYYKPGSIQVPIESQTPVVFAGSSLALSGKIINSNPYPVVDGAVYVKIFRKASGDLNSANWPLLDQFFALENIDIDAQSSREINFLWPVPLHAINGDYQIATFYVSSKRFNLLGLAFTDGSVGNIFDFSVKSEIDSGIELVKSGAKINDEPYNFTSSPTFSEKDFITIEIPITNTTQNTLQASVNWKLYKQNPVLEENMIASSTESILLAKSETKNLVYDLPTYTEPVYFLVAETVNNGVKSIVGMRFSRNISGKALLNFPGVASYPLKAGEQSTIFSCAYRNGNSNGTENNSLKLELIDSDGNPIHAYTYEGNISNAMTGVKGDFVPAKDYSDFTLRATLYADDEVSDTANIKYSCEKINPQMCAKNNNEPTGDYGIEYLVAALIAFAVAFIALFTVLRKKKKIVEYALLFTVAFSFLLIMGSNAHALASGFTGTQMFNTFGSVCEPGEPLICGDENECIGSYWFSYQAPANGTLVITTDGSNFDTLIAVYSGSGMSFDDLVKLGEDDDCGIDGTDSAVAINASKDAIYFIQTYGKTTTGTINITYNLYTGAVPPFGSCTAKSVNAGPDVSTNVGSPVTIFGSASGGKGPNSYAWTMQDNSAACGILGAATLSPVITCASQGTSNAHLLVKDSRMCIIGSDTALVMATLPLIANAGPDKVGMVNLPVLIFGSASGGTTPYSYYWEFTSNPGNSCSIDAANIPNPNITCTAAGDKIIQLTVNDHSSPVKSATDTALITINPGMNSPPTTPTISGNLTGDTDTAYNFVLTSTDADNGNTIKYGIDWDATDGIDAVSEWYPSAGYVSSPPSSPTPGTVVRSWATSGSKSFKALAEDTLGARSGWATHNIAISQPFVVNAGPDTEVYATHTTYCYGITGSILGGVPPYTLNWTTANNFANCTLTDVMGDAGRPEEFRSVLCNTTGSSEAIFTVTDSSTPAQTKSDSLVITSYPILNFSPTSGTYYAFPDESIQIYERTSGGKPPVTYNWYLPDPSKDGASCTLDKYDKINPTATCTKVGETFYRLSADDALVPECREVSIAQNMKIFDHLGADAQGPYIGTIGNAINIAGIKNGGGDFATGGWDIPRYDWSIISDGAGCTITDIDNLNPEATITCATAGTTQLSFTIRQAIYRKTGVDAGEGYFDMQTASSIANVVIAADPLTCGNGILDTLEGCDEPNFSCSPGNTCLSCQCIADEPVCGNGRVEVGEGCGEPGITCNPESTCAACKCIQLKDISIDISADKNVYLQDSDTFITLSTSLTRFGGNFAFANAQITQTREGSTAITIFEENPAVTFASGTGHDTKALAPLQVNITSLVPGTYTFTALTQTQSGETTSGNNIAKVSVTVLAKKNVAAPEIPFEFAVLIVFIVLAMIARMEKNDEQ